MTQSRKWNMVNQRTAWLSPKVPGRSHPTAQKPAQPNQIRQYPFRTLPDHQRSEEGLRLGIDYFFSLRLKQATENLDIGEEIYIGYRLDGCLFNLLRLQAYTKTSEQLIRWYCPCCPHRKSLATHHFLLHRACIVLWARS